MLIPFGILSAAGAGLGFESDFELISTQLITTATANIEFNNIPQDYKHLQFRLTVRSSNPSNTDNLMFYLNNITTNSYATHSLYGNGSGVASNNFVNQPKMYFPSQSIANNQTANIFTAGVIDILDYTSTTKNTTLRSLTGYHGNLSSNISLVSGFLNNTAAITRVNFENNQNIMANSRFSLYGIRG